MRRNGMGISIGFFCLALMTMLLLAHGVYAQSTTNGAIGGSVRDPQGLAIAKAKITVHNAGTSKDTFVEADDIGEFRAANLQPGNYTVTAQAAGFAATQLENVVVQVGSVTEVEVRLKVSSAGATVTVTAEAPLVNTSQQDFATNVNEKAISELPINGRRWSTFALLTPGVVPDGSFGLLSFRGISGLLNNNTVDGGDNNQAFFSEEKGRTRISYSVGQASIQEFQVNTSNFSAEYGRAAGGVVNAVTKSGTNTLHGEGFYFVRDNALGATNPFTTIPTPSGPQKIKPQDRRQQFGAVAGGALIKDKFFWLFSYDGQRRNFPGVATPSVSTAFNPITVALPPNPCPSTALLQGASTSSTGGLTTGQILACRGLTQANADAGLSFLNGLTGEVPRTGNQDLYFPKFDWHITPNQIFSASYNKLIWHSPAGIQTQPSNNLGRASFGNDDVHADSVIAHLYSNFGTKITNEFRFQYGRDNEFEVAQTPTAQEPLTGPNGSSPDVFIPGVFEWGKPTFLNRKAFPDERRLQWADTASYAFRRHLFKFGLDINRVNDVLNNLRFESGSFTYGTVTDFLTDFVNPANACRVRRGTNSSAPAPCYSSYQQAFGPTRFEFNTWDYAFFLQDDWRVHSRLTLNLGIRYEYEKLPDPQIPNPAFPQTSKFPSDKNNWGPRLGFAWDIFGDGKTALRGGYGIYYGRIINSTIANAITNTAVAGAQASFTIRPTDLTFTAPLFPNTLSTAAGTSARPNIQFFDNDFQNPLIQEVDVALERQIGWNTAISFSYLLSRGQELPAFIDTNISPTTQTITYHVIGGPSDGANVTLPYYAGSRPNTTVGSLTDITSIIRSNYNALVVQLNRQAARTLQFMANYTFSHSIDNGQTSTTFTANNSPFDPFNIQADKGNSTFNFPHRFVGSAIWTPTLPENANSVLRRFVNGFSISPIATVSSGYAYSAGTSGSAPGTTQGGGIIGAGGAARAPFTPRSGFIMPAIINFDLRLARDFKFTERYKLQVLGEAFNIFNHQEVNGVVATAYGVGGTTAAPTLTYRTSFGIVSSAGSSVYRERQIQLGLRFIF